MDRIGYIVVRTAETADRNAKVVVTDDAVVRTTKIMDRNAETAVRTGYIVDTDDTVDRTTAEVMDRIGYNVVRTAETVDRTGYIVDTDDAWIEPTIPCISVPIEKSLLH
ncbi:hypothetical protein [Lysinibacillus sp. BPa_S21]|uniref:hypothetical protein n=1 Tax=Lysinibacillus sp. BPa_S21 TaxID=2932478 RepID=UPI0020139C8B|nr:hypothetical protein [Lysinibacillus sp. BPa_S21]